MTAATLYKRFLVLALLSSLVVSVPLPRALSFLPILIGAVGFLAYRPVFGVWPALSKAVFGWAFLFAGLGVLSSLWSHSPEFSLERGFKIMLLLPGWALLVSVALAQDEEMRSFFRKAVPWALVIACTFLVFDLFSRGFLYCLFHECIPGKKFGLSKLNRSTVVIVMAAAAILPFIFFDKTKNQGWWLRLLVLFLMMFGIFYKTESQASQLGFVVGLIFLAVFPYGRKKLWYGFAGLFCLFVMTSPWIAQIMFDVLPDMVKDHEWFQYSYAAQRLEIWDFIARRTLESPLYGFGLESTKAIKDFDTARIYHLSSEILHPHNFILQIWIEFGAIGAALLSGFFLWLFMKIRVVKGGEARLCMPVLMACITVAATTYGLWQAWWLGTFMLLTTFCILSLRDDKNTAAADS